MQNEKPFLILDFPSQTLCGNILFLKLLPKMFLTNEVAVTTFGRCGQACSKYPKKHFNNIFVIFQERGE